ncbi:alpha/beta-hydrolase [Microthyrium microscopicum]|uniref:Carboxylic ester hydrolase n=1 Tax=Microthyrium microscopicum TaxID=703497 RepID=A0A6A6UKM5_9PEZI|nr:alpha/beta-hydrolase [Microthyrium microscopicum]
MVPKLSLSCSLFALAGLGHCFVQEPRVTLDTGIWKGVAQSVSSNTASVHKYLGIPFATVPLRFGPPQLPLESKVERNADKHAPACIQGSMGSTGGPEGRESESEDCLYLNVFTPAPSNASTEGKAVMVWIFGGGLQFGSASTPTYDGTSFAANQDVILVAPNYRTNVFGFPGPIPGVSPKERNLGFLDQRMALQWVQKNIAKFGGDPKRVTIFGESAGARSVDFHLLTNTNNTPFRAVIVQSGSTHITAGRKGRMPASNSSSLPMFVSLAKKLGCSDEATMLECTRKLPVADIKKGLAGLSFGASEDGDFTTVKDAEKWRRDHRAANVSLLIGTNAEEAKLGIAPRGMTLDAYLNANFPAALKQEILAAYKPGPDTPYKTDFDAIAGIETDIGFTCVTSRESKVSAESGYPTWRYLFNASYPNTEKFPGSGAYHSAEIQFVFGNLKAKPPSPPEEISLMKVMQSTWAKFAKNPAEGPGWDMVGSKSNEDLGHFNYNGKLISEPAVFLDRWCRQIWEPRGYVE